VAPRLTLAPDARGVVMCARRREREPRPPPGPAAAHLDAGCYTRSMIVAIPMP